MKSASPNPLCVILHCLILQTVFTVTAGNVHGSDLIKVVVFEGNNGILPCSLNTKENLVRQVFDWTKDGPQKQEVFLYDAGFHYNNGRSGQDKHFRGRVGHIPQELQFGNASIIIANTTVADSGNYTCFFPNRKPQQTFRVELLVAAAPKPDITILDVTQSGVQLNCVIESAFPQPTLQWEDSDGNVIPAEQPEISERGGRYNVNLCATVTPTETNCFYCVVKQEEFHHVNNRKIALPKSLFKERCRTVTFEGLVVGIFLGAFILAAVIALLVATKKLTIHFGKGCQRQPRR